MTKQQYITEMLSEELEKYQIPQEVLKECADAVVHGLDMWYELSGDSVATSNRYATMENEKAQAVKKVEKEMEKQKKEYEDELKQMQRSSSWSIQRKNEQIEELKKQIK